MVMVTSPCIRVIIFSRGGKNPKQTKIHHKISKGRGGSVFKCFPPASVLEVEQRRNQWDEQKRRLEVEQRRNQWEEQKRRLEVEQWRNQWDEQKRRLEVEQRRKQWDEQGGRLEVE